MKRSYSQSVEKRFAKIFSVGLVNKPLNDQIWSKSFPVRHRLLEEVIFPVMIEDGICLTAT